jgi:hypothetical protein
MAAGCIAEDAATAPTGAAEQTEATARSALSDPAVPPALQLQTTEPGSSSATTQSCTFIQWCDRPNSPEKIVCVLRSSCVDVCNTQQGRDSVVSACQNDAVIVCGTSASITYHGCNGLGPA